MTQAEKLTKALLLRFLNQSFAFGYNTTVEVKGKEWDVTLNQKGQIVLRPVDGKGKVIRIHITLTELHPIRRGEDLFNLLSGL